MVISSIRVLVVDDYERWRRFLSTTLLKQPGFHIIGEASDGLEAVQKARELQPDIILLDIGLPMLNGIEASRRIREVSPASRILFVSENRSADIAQEALSTGAGGYIVKSDAGSELLPAVDALLEGKRFVSACLAGHGLNGPTNQDVDHSQLKKVAVAPIPLRKPSHEVGFYSDDQQLLDAVTRFIGTALKAGNSAIIVATESHRNSLFPQLKTHGLDMGAVIEQGRYVALDAAETLSQILLDDRPDPGRFLELLGNLVLTAMEAAKVAHPRVSIFGEGVDLLLAKGNGDAAIQIETLCNHFTKIHDVDILCGYSVRPVRGGMDSQVFQQICAEHSAVYCG